MAVRRWRVYPDHEVQVGSEVTVAVSDELMAESYMKALAIQSAMGGVVSVIVGRQRTDLEGEAVTTGAVFEWKDGVTARVKPEPETSVVPDLDLADAEVVDGEPEPDGLDPATLDVEDDSAIPEPAR